MPVTRSMPRTKSYEAKISDAKGASPLAAFAAYPEQVAFDGQDRGEEIVLLVRQHPVVLVPKFFILLILFVLPIVVLALIGSTDLQITVGDIAFGVGLAIFWALLMMSICAYNFFQWFYNVNIVTTERIVDVNFEKLFYHKVSECQLEKIEDVSHSPVGIWAAVFDYGSVYIQTAAEKREFEFKNVPRPRDIQDTILDLLELKQS